MASSGASVFTRIAARGRRAGERDEGRCSSAGWRVRPGQQARRRGGREVRPSHYVASDEAHDRLDRSIPCASDRHLHRQERDSSLTWLWTFWLISALRRFQVWRRNCTMVGRLRTAYIRVGENPEVRPPSKGGGWIVDGEGFRRLVDM